MLKEVIRCQTDLAGDLALVEVWDLADAWDSAEAWDAVEAWDSDFEGVPLPGPI